MSSAGAPGDWANINALLLANGFPTMLLDGPGQSPGLPAMHTAMMEVLSVLVSPCMHVRMCAHNGCMCKRGRKMRVCICACVWQVLRQFHERGTLIQELLLVSDRVKSEALLLPPPFTSPRQSFCPRRS